MNNLHKIGQQEETEFIKAVLWWITVDTYTDGDSAVIISGNRVDRYEDNEFDIGYTVEEDADWIISAWNAADRPEYIRERIKKG